MKEKVKDNVLEPKIILDQSFFKPKNGRNILYHFSQKILSITLFLYEYKKKGEEVWTFFETHIVGQHFSILFWQDFLIAHSLEQKWLKHIFFKAYDLLLAKIFHPRKARIKIMGAQ